MDQLSPELPLPVELPAAEVKKLSKLPNPSESAAASVHEASANRAVEQGHSQPMADPGFVTPLQPIVQPVGSAALPAQVHAAALPMDAMPAVADDVDLIEKEWVFKAKQIVAQTRDDPYTQNKAMSEVKSDYLKKRFNREVKVSGP